MTRVPRPGLVHHATDSPSVSPIRELGSGGPQRQKSGGGIDAYRRVVKDDGRRWK